MAEEIVELIINENPQPFYKKKKIILILIALAIIVLLALFSWWLSLGKISSAAGRLDTMIYTVGSDYPARLKELYVMTGDLVEKDQPLGVIEAPEFAEQLQTATKELANLRAIAGLPQPMAGEDSAGLIEKEAASKLAQARFEEERLQKIYQNSVTDHVKAQLAMRSIRGGQSAQYQMASNEEAAARKRMQQDLENFEKASKLRAALDQALGKIRTAIMRARQTTGLASMTAVAQSNVASFNGINTLSSPARGSIFRIDGQPGQIIQPGQTVFYILPFQEENASQRWIQAWFNKSERNRIDVGQPVSIRFPDINLHLSGQVEAIAADDQNLPEILSQNNVNLSPLSKSGDINSEKYVPVKISLDEPAKTNDLKPGIAAECQIQTHYIPGFNW